MKRHIALIALVCLAATMSCKRDAPARRLPPPPSPAERLRRATADDWAGAFPLGIAWKTPSLTNGAAINATLTRLQDHRVSLLWVEDAFPNLGDVSTLIRDAKSHGIRVALAPSWAATLQNTNTLPVLHRFWTSLEPKPAAIVVGETLSSPAAMARFGQVLRTNTAMHITTLGTVLPGSAQSFALSIPESAILCCNLKFTTNTTGTAAGLAAFLQDGNLAVQSALKSTMTPLARLDIPVEGYNRHVGWHLWASVSLGFKGVVLAFPSLPSPTATDIPAFKDMADLRPVLGRLVKTEDFLGLTPIRGKTYLGDLTQLFYDPKEKQLMVVVVLSPERPPAEPILLRGGNVTPMASSPALDQLQPGQGGLYQFPLTRETVSAVNEARQYTAVPRHLRDELFVPTFGSGFSVLADQSLNPRLLYCAEPVALLIHPNIVLSPLAGAKPLLVQKSGKLPAFFSAHVSGYTLYRIETVNRYQRIVLLEENGSIPGYDMRTAAIANVAVTNNGICPRAAKKGTSRLPADQCHLQYDIDALRAIAGLRTSYPVFFQFDGSNTEGQQDNRFYVWAGPDAGTLTERLSPRKFVPLVFLKAEDKVLKIGMPYNQNSTTQPVLRRWSFFTWLQPSTPTLKK